MSEDFDAYYKWLAIPPHDQPPDHYRLLGVARFESDEDVIANAADQRMMHLRGFQNGKHAELCQKLLNEISGARLCLLQASSKAAYDEQLQAAAEPAPSANPAASSVVNRPPTGPAVRPGAPPSAPNSSAATHSASRRPAASPPPGGSAPTRPAPRPGAPSPGFDPLSAPSPLEREWGKPAAPMYPTRQPVRPSSGGKVVGIVLAVLGGGALLMVLACCGGAAYVYTSARSAVADIQQEFNEASRRAAAERAARRLPPTTPPRMPPSGRPSPSRPFPGQHTSNRPVPARPPQGSGSLATAEAVVRPAASDVIDLIALVDPRADAVHGAWSKVAGTLTCATQHLVPRVETPYLPPRNYDVRLEFEQEKYRHPICFILPISDGKYGVRHVDKFSANQRHTVRLEVRGTTTEAFLNDVSQGKLDFSELRESGFHNLRDRRKLGIGCDDPTIFYKAVVEPQDAQDLGQLTISVEEAARRTKITARPVGLWPANAVDGMVDLIAVIDPQEDAVHGEWQKQINMLVCFSKHFVPRIEAPYIPPAEYDVLLEFEQASPRNPVGVIFPIEEESHVYQFKNLPANQKVAVRLEVRSDHAEGFINGESMGRVPRDDLETTTWHRLRDSRKLGIGCDDPTTFYSAMVRETNGAGQYTIPPEYAGTASQP
ncbi:hypothetical protein [Lignipirellula cremea]|uniref:Uncharacterized protein n=1 Tax=Lignipirellula cremea TaxID=2528010 RepID=A0A518E2K3_9BACT|nr:hypothetical protein [Lignipirellula cremea]QDU98320.1 hypothetical protein Pla8534_61870 [Lignipirellula cremea]